MSTGPPRRSGASPVPSEDDPPPGPDSALPVREPDPFVCDPERGCITCSDEGVPMRVVQVGADGLATCEDEDGRTSEVMTGLLGTVAPGDRLLVHAGTALLALDESDEGGTE